MTPPATTNMSDVLRDETPVDLEPMRPGRVRVCLCYPNSYGVGMANLAVHTLLRLWRREEGFLVDRAFAPVGDWRDGGDERPRAHESSTELRKFDVLAFSMSFELDYLHLCELLARAGIEPLRRERATTDPLIIVGGPAVSANPSPLSEVADVVFIGEADEAIGELADVLRALGDVPRPRWDQQLREEVLQALAELAGVYVPGMSKPGTVMRRIVRDLEPIRTMSCILTPRSTFGDALTVEVGRGCGRGCAFCLASRLYRPARVRSVEALLEAARVGLQHTEQIGLVSAALSDYPELETLLEALVSEGARVQTSSLRVEGLTEPVLELLARGGAQQITIAPEAATARLRKAIRKTTTNEQIEAVVSCAERLGLRTVKLYFMIGLPSEEQEDVRAIPEFVAGLAERHPRLGFVPAVSCFVPKPLTPFEREPMLSMRELKGRLRTVREAFGRAAPNVLADTAEFPRWSYVQMVLSRGGPELGPVLAEAAKRGSRFGAFREALRQAGHELEEYAVPREDDSGRLPWQIVG